MYPTYFDSYTALHPPHYLFSKVVSEAGRKGAGNKKRYLNLASPAQSSARTFGRLGVKNHKFSGLAKCQTSCHAKGHPCPSTHLLPFLSLFFVPRVYVRLFSHSPVHVFLLYDISPLPLTLRSQQMVPVTNSFRAKRCTDVTA